MGQNSWKSDPKENFTFKNEKQNMKKWKYIHNNELTCEEKAFIFWTVMGIIEDFKSQYSDLSCRTCSTGAIESLDHIIKCPGIVENCEELLDTGDLEICTVKLMQWDFLTKYYE